MAVREKSALYPSVTWNDCMEFIRVIDDFKLKTVAYKAVAEKYGLHSVTTRSFTYRIGTSKQFGLITTSGSTIQLTELARKILYPTSSNIRALELECFSLPPLYASLIERYNNKPIPEETILSNILMNEYRISKSAKDSAAKIFIQNCEHFELIKGGVFVFSNNEENDSIVNYTESVISDNSSMENKEESNGLDNTRLLSNNNYESEYIVQTYPVESGKVAKISIPIDSTEDDLYAIRDLLEVIMRRKFKINLDV